VVGLVVVAGGSTVFLLTCLIIIGVVRIYRATWRVKSIGGIKRRRKRRQMRRNRWCLNTRRRWGKDSECISTREGKFSSLNILLTLARGHPPPSLSPATNAIYYYYYY
jgi:hypothetical protein